MLLMDSASLSPEKKANKFTEILLPIWAIN